MSVNNQFVFSTSVNRYHLRNCKLYQKIQAKSCRWCLLGTRMSARSLPKKVSKLQPRITAFLRPIESRDSKRGTGECTFCYMHRTASQRNLALGTQVDVALADNLPRHATADTQPPPQADSARAMQVRSIEKAAVGVWSGIFRQSRICDRLAHRQAC